MAHALAQVRFQRSTKLPEDLIVNTFHFSTGVDPLDQAAATTITNRLLDFYRVAHTPNNANALQIFMSTLLTTAAEHEVRVYNMDQPVPRAPIRTTTFALTGLAGSPFPAEVAACLSFKGASLSGANPKRRRGRVYIGPLASQAGMGVGGGDARIDNALMTLLADAGNFLRTSAGPTWCVYSEADAALIPVATCWADNAYDIQRRRGAKATLRTVRPAA